MNGTKETKKGRALIDYPGAGDAFVRLHGSGCAGPILRNAFGVEYCSWCGKVARLVVVNRV